MKSQESRRDGKKENAAELDDRIKDAVRADKHIHDDGEERIELYCRGCGVQIARLYQNAHAGSSITTKKDDGGGWPRNDMYDPSLCTCDRCAFLGKDDDDVSLKFIIKLLIKKESLLGYDLDRLEDKIPRPLQLAALGVLRSDNGYLDLARKCMDKLHPGDDYEKMVGVICCVTVALPAGNLVHIMVVGTSQRGKSHLNTSCCKLFSDHVFEYDRLSALHLIYAASENPYILQKKIINWDEFESSKEAWDMEKAITGPDKKRVVHGTVIKNKSHKLVLESLPLVLTSLVEPPDDLQICNRHVKLNIDESLEQLARIRLHLNKLAAEGYDPDKDKEIELFRCCTKLLFADELDVSIPYLSRIYFPITPELGTTQFKQFVKVLKAVALTNRFNRELDDHGNVIADESDFEYIAEIWNNILPQQQLQINKGTKEIYDVLGTEYGLTVDEIHAKLPHTKKSAIYKRLERAQKKGLLYFEMRERVVGDDFGEKKIKTNEKEWYREKLSLAEEIRLLDEPITAEDLLSNNVEMQRSQSILMLSNTPG